MDSVIKTLLSILMLGCLFNMPYSYYEFVRLIFTVGFGYLTYSAYKNNRTIDVFVYIVLGLLFQPFYKISLGRILWNIIDVFVAFGLVLSILKNQTNKHEN